jgi:type IV pilus modification protein PilV
MLEVLIAMAIGAIGVIAFAALQLRSYEVSEEARYRSHAGFIALEMAERISSNSQDLTARQIYQGDDGDYWTRAPIDNGAYTIDSFCTKLSEPCNAATLASSDITTVKNIARATLPNGDVGHKKCGDADVTGSKYDCIIVAWNEEADDIQNCSLGTDGSGLNDCYILQIKVW